MSAVIGVCGVNFCTLVSDTRMVTNDHNSKNGLSIISEDCRKIFKVNDHLLFRCTGWYHSGETILDPLNSFVDKSAVTLNALRDSCKNHLETNAAMIYNRNYIIGEKRKNGTFRLCEMHFNPSTRQVESMIRAPAPDSSNFAISFAIPGKVNPYAGHVNAKIEECIHASRTLDDLIHKLGSVISMISEIDDTVGNKAISLTLT